MYTNPFLLVFLYAASVSFLLLIVVNANKQKIICIFSHFGRILLAFNLGDSRIGILIVFQFKHDGW